VSMTSVCIEVSMTSVCIEVSSISVFEVSSTSEFLEQKKKAGVDYSASAC
jgi:hypothetical protein